ncbi:ABC transporter ATP-binding protein [Oricola thermophila]|uniref:ABC transporter ATP-binding protein n=1 Tax=Oricola thermophila TaxID=2742145 RepID=A0A6N1VDY2_9HYPH|nr:ABC transporter ATP-binding protein [Oricola thermophila]QKV19140.1 ABC transporter ATP-binding protein [Oricola thermophila]
MSQPVDLQNVSMIFGDTRAVNDVSFTVAAGEFFSILGPSGCGKTTLLRIIAGFLQPAEGKVLIGDSDMTGLGPDQRPTAMIFQSLALFPLMSVWENIAFGLEARGMAKAARRAKAEELLTLVALEGYGDRMPGELSGGQRQRVAIARALAVEPQVLLLDEPLSALDLKLRQHMRSELRALQKRTGVTFIYITHDQSEALAMSDRVAVMSAGILQQVGSPRELYDNPATPFVARFVGETNTIAGKVTTIEKGIASLDTPYGVLRGRVGHGLSTGMPARLYVRPEALAHGSKDENKLTATIGRIDFEGAFALAHGKLPDDSPLIASIASIQLGNSPTAGSSATFGFRAENAVVLPDV